MSVNSPAEIKLWQNIKANTDTKVDTVGLNGLVLNKNTWLTPDIMVDIMGLNRLVVIVLNILVTKVYILEKRNSQICFQMTYYRLSLDSRCTKTKS